MQIGPLEISPGIIVWTALVLVFLMIAATTWLAGFWSCLLTLTLTILSALIATAFQNRLSATLLGQTDQANDLRYNVFFVAFWILFLGSFLILRVAVEIASPHRMAFDTLTEFLGRSILAPLIAFCFLAFATYTIHSAPMPSDGDWPRYFSPNGSKSAFGVGLDRVWSNYFEYAAKNHLKENRMMARILSTPYPIYQNAAGEKYYVRPGAKGASQQIAFSGANGSYGPLLIPFDFYSQSSRAFRAAVAAYNQKQELTNEMQAQLRELIQRTLSEAP